MGTIEVEGESREDALAYGLAQLGLREADVNIETIDSGKRFLGILGRSLVRLRLHYSDGSDRLDVARGTLERLITGMGFEVSINTQLVDGEARLELTGEELSLLIGRRGETLDALEYLVGRIVNRPPHERIRVVLDAEGYRERVAGQLREMALRLAEKAVRTGEQMPCRPMNARDRRVVHLALRDETGVETFSEGEGVFRRVIILPAR